MVHHTNPNNGEDVLLECTPVCKTGGPCGHCGFESLLLHCSYQETCKNLTRVLGQHCASMYPMR